MVNRLHETISEPDETDHQKIASAAISNQFEEEDVVGPWSEAIESLGNDERALLFAMAVDGGPADGIGTNWVLEQPLDMTNPYLRDSLQRFVSRLDPNEWSGYQHALASAVLAVEWLSRAGLEIPSILPCEGQVAWNNYLALVAALARNDQEGVKNTVAVLLADHSDSIADFLCAVRWAGVVMHPDGQRVERRVVDAFGTRLSDVLIRSLDQQGQRSSLLRLPAPDERLRNSIELLGRIGGSRAAEKLRLLADDPTVGESAVTAVRAIEARR